MRGARQWLPDPYWKTREKQGARTSGGNNNDDDNQFGDIPSLMFKEESNRGELRKKIPAKLKKMAPLKENVLLDQL